MRWAFCIVDVGGGEVKVSWHCINIKKVKVVSVKGDVKNNNMSDAKLCADIAKELRRRGVKTVMSVFKDIEDKKLKVFLKAKGKSGRLSFELEVPAKVKVKDLVDVIVVEADKLTPKVKVKAAPRAKKAKPASRKKAKPKKKSWLTKLKKK